MDKLVQTVDKLIVIVLLKENANPVQKAIILMLMLAFAMNVQQDVYIVVQNPL